MLSFVAYVGEYLFVSAFIRGTDGDADMKRPTFSRFFFFRSLTAADIVSVFPSLFLAFFVPLSMAIS